MTRSALRTLALEHSADRAPRHSVERLVNSLLLAGEEKYAEMYAIMDAVVYLIVPAMNALMTVSPVLLSDTTWPVTKIVRSLLTHDLLATSIESAVVH